MRERTKREFTYKDSRFLNRLVMFINSENCELSATLMPDNDEFIQADNDSSNSWHVFSSPIPEVEKVLRDRELGDDKKRALVMLPMFKKHGVIPFWALNFDYEIYRGEPRMVYSGPQNSQINNDFQVELMRRLRHPSLFAKISDKMRWHYVQFSGSEGKERVDTVKQGIALFLKTGYRVVRMHAELEPRVRGGDYVDFKESKASMFAGNGKIEIYGNVPGFDEKFDEDLEIFRKVPELPAPINDLEELIKSVK